MSIILKFDFQKIEQLGFTEVNYLNYTKRPNFAFGNYIFPKTRGNKNKPWTHSTPLRLNDQELLLCNSFACFRFRHSRTCIIWSIYFLVSCSFLLCGSTSNPPITLLLSLYAFLQRVALTLLSYIVHNYICILYCSHCVYNSANGLT